jgi:hypothetical protein
VRVKRFAPRAVGVVIILAVALATVASAGAQATGGGQAASACSNDTYNGGKYVGKETFRFVLKGNVSCTEAHRTMGEYVRALAAGRCPSRICDEVSFPGGWTCSVLSSVESHEDGGLVGGCERRGASFGVYKASRPTSETGTLHLSEFLSPDRKVWCAIGRSGFCGTAPNAEPNLEAKFGSGGSVTICHVAVPTFSEGCLQNEPLANTPILRVGQATEREGVRCTSASSGIICTIVAGAGKGKGFRINRREAVRVG